MLALGILAFLSGAVLAGAFRVWILVPATLLAFVVPLIWQIWQETSFLSALGVSVGVAVAPQFGFAFGLMAKAALNPALGHSSNRAIKQRAGRINDAKAP